MTAQHPPMPPVVAALPRDRHGRPIPYFVHVDEHDAPDFRVIGHDRLEDAHRFDLCWVCGRRRGRHAAFVIGPMCAVNRVSAEPPSHLDCAIYSATACPFLTTPTMTRRETGLVDHVPAPGVTITRNPGVALVWSSRTWAQFDVAAQGPAHGGVLWDVGDPTAARWYAHGRDATRTEVADSITAGVPALRAECARDRDPISARAALELQLFKVIHLMPTASTDTEPTDLENGRPWTPPASDHRRHRQEDAT